ncbi:GNAT family N-acetyltransferase [Gryllotalpicola protaetiae]|uniref:GNAT family N-acetyltransferase n=1 Tax=Gryllotalpicola protaetiae TaxID=2419771 RepID=A0A387BQG1_9MICO|nr:GNAT family N-acetyltransferase [Gryllotalpicola protaetiae]AYG03270.1 GNAT family N-acetyltransferase [Gryllotalpicola protaetiae]
MVAITPIRPEDRAEWLELWDGYLTFYEEELDDTTTLATFARVSTAGSSIHGALARGEDGRAIGLVHWLTHPSTWTVGDYCYLEDLFVSPDARRSGAGAALIEHVRAWAAEHGSAKVYWLTAETNATARALYDRVATQSGFTHYEIGL